MREPRKPEWETVYYPHDGGNLERIEVPGGSLYRSTQWLESHEEGDSERTESMAFVPDPRIATANARIVVDASNALVGAIHVLVQTLAEQKSIS